MFYLFLFKMGKYTGEVVAKFNKDTGQTEIGIENLNFAAVVFVCMSAILHAAKSADISTEAVFIAIMTFMSSHKD